MSSSAHHPTLYLLDIRLDLHLGLLGMEPSSLLLELEWSTLCVSVLHVSVMTISIEKNWEPHEHNREAR